MGGTTSKYGVSGLGGQRGRVMSMALDRVRDEGIPMGEALQQSWQFVANEAMGVEQPDRLQATQAPLTPPAPVKEPLDKFKKGQYYSEDIAMDIKNKYGADAIHQYMTDFFNLYTVDELKAINKVDRMDNSGRIRNSKNKDKIIAIMTSAVEAHVTHGDAFWNYGDVLLGENAKWNK